VPKFVSQIIEGAAGKRFTVKLDGAVVKARREMSDKNLAEIQDGYLECIRLQGERIRRARAESDKHTLNRKKKVIIPIVLAEEYSKRPDVADNPDTRKHVLAVAKADFWALSSYQDLGRLALAACAQAIEKGDLGFFREMAKGNLFGTDPAKIGNCELEPWQQFYFENWILEDPESVQLCTFSNLAVVEFLKLLGFPYDLSAAIEFARRKGNTFGNLKKARPISVKRVSRSKGGDICLHRNP
jgi:hypothetical protein